MKKICFITTIPGTLRSFILKTAIYLHENTDWDISFICNYDEEFENELPEYIHYFPVNMKRGISISGIKAMLEMIKIFKREKFDMVQYSTPNAAFVASIAAKLAGVKIRNYHLMGFRYLGAQGVLRLVLKIIEKITCQFSTHIECVSKSNLELGVKEKIFKPEKACVVWNGSTGGVDLKRFDFSKRQQWRKEIRKTLGYTDDNFVFGYVGRITKDKGINELFSAFLSLENQAELLVVGTAEGVDTLDKEVYKKAKENENILFHDAVKDIEKYFAAIDVLVLPSYREGFGNVIIEAAAVGTPAIVSNIPGPIDAVVFDETAKIVEVKNVAELKNAMEVFLADKAFVQEMSQKAHNFVCNNFNSEKLNEKILERKRVLLRDDNE